MYILGTSSISELNRGDDLDCKYMSSWFAEANPLLIKQEDEEEGCRGRGGEMGGRKSKEEDWALIGQNLAA